MSVAVSIVSFNTKDLLRECLNNLSNQKFSQKLNVWVLDNNSSDGSAQMVKHEFPKVKLIESQKNLGFAKGQNEIIKKTDDEFVLLLNPDTKFDKNMVEGLTDFMKKNPDCMIESCKLVDFEGNLQSNGGDFPFGKALYSWLFNLEIFGVKQNFHREDRQYYTKSHTVDWVAGTVMMVRSSVFKLAGYLSEDFFMYFEDTEFCYRVSQLKGKIMLNSGVTVSHQSGSSSENPRLSQWKGEFKGLLKFYKKYTGFFGGIYARILIYKAIILRMLAFMVLGKFKKVSTYAEVFVAI